MAPFTLATPPPPIASNGATLAMTGRPVKRQPQKEMDAIHFFVLQNGDGKAYEPVDLEADCIAIGWYLQS